MNKKDREFLDFIADRMVNVHGENENYYYISKLRELASQDDETEKELEEKELKYDLPAFPVPANTKGHKKGLTKLEYAKLEVRKAYPHDDADFITAKAKEMLENE